MHAFVIVFYVYACVYLLCIIMCFVSLGCYDPLRSWVQVPGKGPFRGDTGGLTRQINVVCANCSHVS